MKVIRYIVSGLRGAMPYLTLMIQEKNIFQTLECSPNSCDFTIDILTQNNRIIEKKYARICITRRKFSSSYVLPLDIELPLLLFYKCTKICRKSYRHIVRNIHLHTVSCRNFNKWLPTSHASGFGWHCKLHSPPVATRVQQNQCRLQATFLKVG